MARSTCVALACGPSNARTRRSAAPANSRPRTCPMRNTSGIATNHSVATQPTAVTARSAPAALSTAAAVNAVASSAVRQRTPLSVSCWTGVAARMRCMSITTTAQADAACAANVTKVVPVMSTTLNGLAGHAASQSDRTLKTGSRGEVSASTVHAAIITTATAAITRRCPGCSSRPVGNDSDA